MKTRQGLPAPRRPRTSHRPLRAGHFVLFLSACALLGGCASPGEPIERKPPVPQAVGDLMAAQSGDSVVLTFTLPKETVDRRSLDHPPAIEIFRDFETAGGTAAPHPTLHATIPAAVVDTYTQQDRVRYTEALQPEDFTQHSDGSVVYIVRTRVSAKKSSADSNTTTLHIHPAPDPIEDLKAEVTHAGIQLAWTPPQKTVAGPAPPIAGYRIYRAESEPTAAPPSSATEPGATGAKAASPVLKMGETETPGYMDTQFEPGKTYQYTVRSTAKYGEDQIESADSNPFVVLARDVTPPSTPQGLLVVDVPAQGDVPAHLELSWGISPETDLAGYNVYRSDREGVLGMRVNTELLLTPAFRDMNAVPGRRYFYSVTAVDRSGNESPVSAAASGAVPAESPTTP
jgi:hypothetical protein